MRRVPTRQDQADGAGQQARWLVKDQALPGMRIILIDLARACILFARQIAGLFAIIAIA